MKRIEYQISYAEGQEEIVAVFARNINSGFTKALMRVRKGPELHAIKFWQVTS